MHKDRESTVPDLYTGDIKGAYRAMLRIRIIEEIIADTYKEQQMRCPVHLSIGQEAIAVGVSSSLATSDFVLSTHRAHAHYLAKGGDLKAMMAELYLKATGTCHGKGGSMHLIDRSVGFMGAIPIVGSSIAAGVGVAFGSAMQGNNAVTVSFFGEAAIEEGVFHESVNFAVLKSLPVVFICENNLYSVNSPLIVRQPVDREVLDMVNACGLPAFRGDGNDIFEVSKLTQQAVNKARDGNGPTFLEFTTYRWREHCGPNYDFDLGYRSEEEFNDWKKRDPIFRLEIRLLSDGLIESNEIESMKDAIREEMASAIDFAKNSPFPEPDSLFDRVYAR